MKNKNIAVICSLDGYANSNMPLAIKKQLEKRGHKVKLINTYYINNIILYNNDISYLQKIYLIIVIFCKSFLTLLSILQRTYFSSTNHAFFYYLLLGQMKMRAYLLNTYFNTKNFDYIICESSIDSLLFLYPQRSKTLYDCATPWADELYYGNKLTYKQYKKFLSLEKKVYKKVTYLSFHWSVYTDYVKKYIYKGTNHLSFNSGCVIKKDKAQFNSTPKIVYMGFLEGDWINLDLLSKLTKMYPQIDVYGAPVPPKKYQLNYKGYSSTNVLSNYQFGLITLSKDRLRREGFSAKHIEYLSFGLPVLLPEWRTSAKNLKGTIFYNEKKFLTLIKKYSKETTWRETSNAAVTQAKEYQWDNALLPLVKIIEN